MDFRFCDVKIVRSVTFFIKIAGIFLILIMTMSLLPGCSKKEKIPIQISGDSGSDDGQTGSIIRINVNEYGSMTFRLMDSQAPEAAEAFKKLASEGYYDNKPVYMLIRDYCMIAGEESGTADEDHTAHDDLQKNSSCYPLRGALCFTQTVQNGGFSCENFTIIQTGSEFISELEELLKYKKVTLSEYFKQAYGNETDEDTLDIFRKYGGAPWIYGHCIVFGQLTEGEEVMDKICATEIYDDSAFRPMEEIIIGSIEVLQ